MNPRHSFKPNDRVQIIGRTDVMRVAAGYRVENFDVYELVEQPDFLVKAHRLQAYEPNQTQPQTQEQAALTA